MTESDIHKLLAKESLFKKRYEVMIPNCFTSIDNEADVLAIRKSGICDEFEIKVSRSDFLNDAKKIVRYRSSDITSGEDNKWFTEEKTSRAMLAPWESYKRDALMNGFMTCNYFWYVLKDGIASVDEVPKFAGLIFVSNEKKLNIIRWPEKLKKEKLTFEQRYLFSLKLNNRFWELHKKNDNVVCTSTPKLSKDDLGDLMDDIATGEWEEFKTITLKLPEAKSLVEFALNHSN
jgi:hypothetical protein